MELSKFDLYFIYIRLDEYIKKNEHQEYTTHARKKAKDIQDIIASKIGNILIEPDPLVFKEQYICEWVGK